jgi:2-polyprenyl-3-methyl-5-hydroxy-6-metoxy-1,4-benzoquinol methylase
MSTEHNAAQVVADAADPTVSGYAAELAVYLERVAVRPDIQHWHGVALDMLGLRPGQTVLEAGCGVGIVARDLARMVGPHGHVVAMDLSQLIITEASKRHEAGLPVAYQVGDVTALPHADGSFDVVRCERVLQHLTDPDLALREMARVTRPGGRVCVLDPDWATMAVDVDDPEMSRRIVGHFVGRIPQPDFGRTLRRRLVRAGLTGVQLVPLPFQFTELADVAEIFPVFDEHIPREADVVPAADRDAWFAAVRRADKAGELTVAFLGFVACGVKPPGSSTVAVG